MSEDIINKVEGEVKKFNWAQIASFWEENPGEFSMTRLILSLVFFLPFAIWAIISIHNWALVDLPSSVVTIQGSALVAKGVAKYQENKAAN